MEPQRIESQQQQVDRLIYREVNTPYNVFIEVIITRAVIVVDRRYQFQAERIVIRISYRELREARELQIERVLNREANIRCDELPSGSGCNRRNRINTVERKKKDGIAAGRRRRAVLKLKLARSPLNFRPRTLPIDCTPVNSINFNCLLCYGNVRDAVITICGHVFCWPCLWAFLTSRFGFTRCPYCKRFICVHEDIISYFGGTDINDTEAERRNLVTRPSAYRILPTSGELNWLEANDIRTYHSIPSTFRVPPNHLSYLGIRIWKYAINALYCLALLVALYFV